VNRVLKLVDDSKKKCSLILLFNKIYNNLFKIIYAFVELKKNKILKKNDLLFQKDNLFLSYTEF